MPKIVALVPMRHHSQRVRGKNYRLLAGKPLYHYIITSLTACPEISQVVVDTDSQPIMDGLRQAFPTVSILERPERLRGDAVSMNDILEYDCAQMQADYYLQTHSTNPLLRPATISKSIQYFYQNIAERDSLFSVTRRQVRLYDQDGRAINHNPAVLIQTQDLPPVYEENSCIYIFSEASLLRHHHRIGEHPLMFEVEAAEAWDIDDELDFTITECLMKLNLPKS